jgi:hypothetical protein
MVISAQEELESENEEEVEDDDMPSLKDANKCAKCCGLRFIGSKASSQCAG